MRDIESVEQPSVDHHINAAGEIFCGAVSYDFNLPWCDVTATTCVDCGADVLPLVNFLAAF
ncbi:hypothetical protein [Fodinicola feengrottensis]|uniref:Uncharacterized protein n=1 Tax=Fodinicola feengrottensis TaxID=435914 RepID=A0ABP4UAG0_9ACTN|nr:hypothetical protein [Fodinicola feengrottensis]